MKPLGCPSPSPPRQTATPARAAPASPPCSGRPIPARPISRSSACSAHSSGIIGLPLRLLAREVYNKVVDRVGADAVALITGEEKIKPPNPRFWVSTVEAMPRDLDVAFVAIDEVQLGADLERGHVFTDRMLNRRGREETLVLGAATMRPMVERLLPGAHIVSPAAAVAAHLRGREEAHAAAAPLRHRRVLGRGGLCHRRIDPPPARRRRGGARRAVAAHPQRAGRALSSPGDVDYLVATDAIGMGLNLDVDHVAFASDRKFDGYQFRKLNPAELAQIAGRAGRATRDGTFGTTGRCPPFETELAQALESHSFEPIKVLQWRNTALDFSSIGALQASLAGDAEGERADPRADRRGHPGARTRGARRRRARARDDAAGGRAAVGGLPGSRLPQDLAGDPCRARDDALWLPDARGHNSRPTGSPARSSRPTSTDGDIDTLSNRIAHIRTWTFAANRPDWLADPEHWQGVTRAVEDKLSDALHERLTERFVDRRTSVLMRRLRENTMLETDISKTGEVVVEGHHRPARRLHVRARCVGRRLGGQGARRRRAEGARRRDRRARDAVVAGAGRAVRARHRRHHPLARPGRSASSSPARKCSSRACASSPTST